MPYSAKVIRLNKEANPDKLGVALGRACIQRGISVQTVCTELGVSKAIVYRWFSGAGLVGKHLRPKVEAYYRSTLLGT